jgi:PPOX class probable F420-dependent enzyme
MHFMVIDQSQQAAKDPFAYLVPQEFIVLTTYRKSGAAVPTTVWFAYDQGKIYITTGTASGKIKRVRNNGRVQMTPSDRVGNLLGQPEVAGEAKEVQNSEGKERAQAVLQKKYGEQFQRIASQNTENRTYIVVEPTA